LVKHRPIPLARQNAAVTWPVWLRQTGTVTAVRGFDGKATAGRERGRRPMPAAGLAVGADVSSGGAYSR
jgi:hypothetical protein